MLTVSFSRTAKVLPAGADSVTKRGRAGSGVGAGVGAGVLGRGFDGGKAFWNKTWRRPSRIPPTKTCATLFHSLDADHGTLADSLDIFRS